MPASDFQCEFCSGQGYEFSQDSGAVPCLLCDGSGLATLLGDLGPTHSQKRRPFAYSPGCRRLSIGIGQKAVSYTVSEFKPGAAFEGRAFALDKHGTSERYSCLIGAQAATCDCAGKTYLNTEKANLRSWLRDDREFPSEGCKHLDVLRVLLNGGWLDAPEHIPAEHRD